MISTTLDKKNIKGAAVRTIAVLFWIALWQVLSTFVGHSILLPSPLAVICRLFELLPTLSMWQSVWFTFERIVTGFLLSLVLGVIFAVLSYKSRLVSTLLHPLMVTVKSVPVASFVVLALMWIPSKNLSLFISFLMVLPIVYTNVLSGLTSTDKKMLEMAKIFRLSPIKKALYVYISHVMPYFRSGVKVGLGLCWKAGVAAELIGVPRGSIGENLYYSKIYLQSADLFAWTAVIVFVSFAFEKIFVGLVDLAVAKCERM